MPFLSRISVPPMRDGSYLQQIPSLREGLRLELKNNVTFFVGENGSGKSTLLSSAALACEVATATIIKIPATGLKDMNRRWRGALGLAGRRKELPKDFLCGPKAFLISLPILMNWR